MEVKETVRKEALELIKGHIKEANICMTTNNILDWPLQRESLNNQWLDPDGNIWILSFPHKGDQAVYVNGKMEIFYSNRVKSTFLSLVGTAHWGSFAEAERFDGFPFSRAKEVHIDTPIRLIKFVPTEAYYWDDLTKDMTPIVLFENIARDSERLVA
jgi:hypothetical protein